MINIILQIPSLIAFSLLFSLFPVEVSADVDESLSNEIIEKYGSSVFTVNAYTKIKNVERKSNNKSDGWCQNVGTAFLFDNFGHLIAFNCVIKNAEKIKVLSSYGREISVDVLGNDNVGKINVLKTEHALDISTPEVTELENISLGEEVVMLGLKERVLTAISGKISNIRPSDGTIVVDVYGDPGTTGTPVFDRKGLLLGFLASRIENDEEADENLALSESESYVVIPAKSAHLIALTLINRAEDKCGWLGISSDINDIDNSDNKGVEIQGIMKHSPAEKSGLRINDFLLEFNSVAISSPFNLIEALSGTKAGDTVSIKVRRGNEIISSKVTLSAQP